MTREERIMERLKELLIDDYNQMIEEDNRERNDGNDLGRLMDVFIETGSGRIPYARISVRSGEHTEKDRILRNVVYSVEVRIVSPETKESWRTRARYRELLERLIEEHRRDAAWESASLGSFRGDECVLRITG